MHFPTIYISPRTIFYILSALLYYLLLLITNVTGLVAIYRLYPYITRYLVE